MKRKTIFASAAVAAVVIAGAVAIPAIAAGPGGWGPMGCDRGPGMMMQRMHGGMGWHRGPGRMGGFANNPVFLSFDSDKDGTVTAAEAEAGIDGLRKTYDADSDGALSRAEFDALFAEVTRSFAERPFTMLDADEDGKLSAEEMQFPAKMMARMQKWHGQPTEAPNNQ